MKTHDATRKTTTADIIDVILHCLDAAVMDANDPAEVMALLRDDLDRRLAVMRAGPSIATVLGTVSRATGVSAEQILSRDRSVTLDFARKMTYLACREFTPRSYDKMGQIAAAKR